MFKRSATVPTSEGIYRMTCNEIAPGFETVRVFRDREGVLLAESEGCVELLDTLDCNLDDTQWTPM